MIGMISSLPIHILKISIVFVIGYSKLSTDMTFLTKVIQKPKFEHLLSPEHIPEEIRESLLNKCIIVRVAGGYTVYAFPIETNGIINYLEIARIKWER